MDSFATRFDALRDALAAWLASPSFYFQGTAIVAVLLIASALTPILRRSIPVLRDEPEGDARIRRLIHRTRVIVLPLLVVLLLAIAIRISEALFSESWLFLIAQGIAVAVLLQTLVRRFVDNRLIAILLTWVGIPLATLQVFGWLDDVARELNSMAISVGNIRLSALAIGRTLFFGTILFWLGRVSNDSGKEAIRNYPNLDQGTREVIAKLFEIVVFVALFLLLLQVMGINLTALAVFGGALGIGLGMGMQRIAANFISGVIILLERSLSLGDYVELADGRAGTLRELNMRAATLETFDGKEIPGWLYRPAGEEGLGILRAEPADRLGRFRDLRVRRQEAYPEADEIGCSVARAGPRRVSAQSPLLSRRRIGILRGRATVPLWCAAGKPVSDGPGQR